MSSYDRTRRDTLKLLGAGAAAAALTPARARAESVVADGPPLKYFSLADVRLSPGPFLDAQRLDEAYLLQLEPDRMLHNFRRNAGLKPKARVYGGWESVEPWIEIRCHGHTLGHYLTATACIFESTGDERFGQRVDYIVAELAECQAKTGGWLTAFPDGVAPLVDSLAGKPFAGVPWYTVHKVLAGLRDAHLHRGNAQALTVLTKFCDWIDETAKNVPDERFQKMLDREHGGMNEVLADASALAKQPRFLALAKRFSHRALLDPLLQKRDALDGLHANTQIPKVIGFKRIGSLAFDVDWSLAAHFFWRTVTETRSYVTGGHGDVEHFFPKTQFAQRLGSAKTMETCCTHNMLRLTRALHAQTPAPIFMDYFERALFNGILASQDPLTGMNTYFQSTRPGYVRLYHTPFDSFWCCTGSGLENHARYGETIFAHGTSALYVCQFLSATLNWRNRGITVTQQTRFPDSDTTRLTFRCEKPQDLTIKIRRPAWCESMTVRVNGRRTRSEDPEGYRYHSFALLVRDGDVIDVHLPMRLTLEPLPNAPEHAAVMYGPIVLAARLGTQGLSPGSQLIVNERKSGEMLTEPIDIPTWSKPLAELPASLERTGEESITFATTGFEGGRRVEFIPWFRLAHERYNLYWQGVRREKSG